MKTVVPSQTHKEAAAPVCAGAEPQKPQKRTALLQPGISPGDLFHSLQTRLSTLTAADLYEAKQGLYSYVYIHRKLLGRIAAIFLATAAIVGIASIRNSPEVSVVTAVPTKTEITPAAQAEAAVASRPITNPKTSAMPLIGDFGFSLEPAEQSVVPTRLPAKVKESLVAPKPEPIPSPASTAEAEAPRPAPEPTVARKEFVEIAVELKIQDGRVAEAQVGHRQPGAEAFEATALQIARRRRYAPGTSRTETVVLRIANQSGKEP